MDTQEFLDSLDQQGYDIVKNQYDRGDFHDITEKRKVENWLKAKTKERKFIAECEQASRSAAYYANKLAIRSNIYALIAVAISIIAAKEEIASLIRAALGP